MEAAFVYGTVHQFVLTTEATLLKDTGYVQTHSDTHINQAELLPCTICSICGFSASEIKSGMVLGYDAKGGQSDLFCFSKMSCCLSSWTWSSHAVCDCSLSEIL